MESGNIEVCIKNPNIFQILPFMFCVLYLIYKYCMSLNTLNAFDCNKKLYNFIDKIILFCNAPCKDVLNLGTYRSYSLAPKSSPLPLRHCAFRFFNLDHLVVLHYTSMLMCGLANLCI